MQSQELIDIAKNASVLFVEDDDDSRGAMLRVLSAIFADVGVAYDGKQALDMYKARLKSKPYNIVITDLSLGEFSGIALIKEIKQLNPEQSIIVISAYEQPEIFLDIIESGVDLYLLKPINSKRFLDGIEKCLKNKKLSEIYKQTLKVQLEQQNKLIDSIMTVDELTGLENEKSFFNFLEQKDNFFTLALIKIDNLINIKNLTGKEYCNFYLKELTNLINDYFETSGRLVKLYRVDFDELAIILDEPLDRAEKIADELNALAKYFFCELNGINLNSTFTIGLYYGNSNVYTKAKFILANAQENAKGSYLSSSSTQVELDKDMQQNIYWLKKFSESIESDLLIPYFQPIFDNNLNRITKYECLARIKDQNLIIEPSKFLNLVSSIRQTPFLTKVIIRKAIEYFRDKDDSIEFSINLSLHDLQDNSLLKNIDYWTKRYQLNPKRIVFELLETEDMYKNTGVKNVIQEIKERGCKLAIDDFGTGYSNLIYLHEFKVDYIKIDGSFIRNLDCDDSLYDFVSYIDKLIKLTGAKSIAEFVANEKIQSIVKKIGIDYSQGYVIGKPQREIIFA